LVQLFIVCVSIKLLIVIIQTTMRPRSACDPISNKQVTWSQQQTSQLLSTSHENGPVTGHIYSTSISHYPYIFYLF